MSNLGGLRDRYGDVFVSKFEDMDVPWKPLSTRDFIKYQADIATSIIPAHVLEEEIFQRCVVDQKIAKNLHLKAGVVPTVAAQILQFSGPSTPEEFNQELDLARAIVKNHPLHEAVVLICRAFPGYNPEEAYSLSYPDLMLRLAQAEALLLQAKILQQPLKMTQDGVEEREEQPRQKIVPRGLKEAWEASRAPKSSGMTQEPTQVSKEAPRPSNGPRRSPVMEALDRGKAYLGSKNSEVQEEIGAATSGVGNWDKADLPVIRARMVTDAREIYKDLIADLGKRDSGARQ